MVFADRILALWLGEEFSAAGTATVIFLGWWLVAPNVAFANSVLTVDRAFRALATYAWGVAALNLTLSLIFTPLLGLEGVVIGTTGAYVAALPFYMRYFMRRRGLQARDYARVVWIPVYGSGLLLAGLLLLARFALSIEDAAGVAALALLGPAVYWAAFYLLLLDTDERRLVREIVSPARA
jgi:O-antigen/teichoic acid export membrane protein